MRLLKILVIVFVVVFLTALTQVGGVVFLISVFLNPHITKFFASRWSKWSVKFLSFIVLYLFSVFIVVPLIAKPLGRVSLPLFKTNNLQPGTILTCLLNR